MHAGSRQRRARAVSAGWAARLAQREMRGDGGRRTKWGFLPGFRIFLLCLILGIFTISGVGSLSAALVAGMVAQGQNILGGDIDVRLIHRPASAEERDFLSGNGRLSEIATMRAMLRHQDEAMLVEAKAVDAAYPLYGKIVVKDTNLAAALASRDGIDGAAVEQGLLDRLGLPVGSVVQMGDIQSVSYTHLTLPTILLV